jgi:hypothetical protein
MSLGKRRSFMAVNARRSRPAEPSQVDDALADAKRGRRLLVTVASLAESIAVVGTIASKFPVWSVSGILVGIPVATVAFLQ